MSRSVIFIILVVFALFVVNKVQGEGEEAVDLSNEALLDTDSTTVDEEAEPEISDEKFAEMMKQLQGQGQGNMFGGMDGGRRYARDIPPVEEDVPHIQCQACQELVKHLQQRLGERREKLKKTKVTELEILEMLEPVCDPITGDGEWITKLDIVERDNQLVLENRDEIGHCEEECKTIALACENIVREFDSDIAELLYTNKPKVADKICAGVIKKLKGACGQPPIPIREGRVASGDNFRPKSDIDIALAEAGKELRKKQEINPDFLRDDL